MSAPYDPTLGEVHGIDQDFQGFQLARFRIWNVTTSITAAYAAGAPGDGAMAYNAVNGAKRLKFYDTQLAADVLVPRLDYPEQVTAQYGFNYNSGSSFTVASTTRVDNLNAHYLADTGGTGRSGDIAATANTVAIRDSNARLTAAAPDGTTSGQVVTFGFLNTFFAGVRDPKQAVRFMYPSNLYSDRAYTFAANVITSSANGAIGTAGVVDGVTVAVGDRLGLVSESGGSGPNRAAYNGIYTVTAIGDASNPFVLTRSTDADESLEVTNGMQFWVTEGTTKGASGWLLTTDDPITLNTTPLTFIQNNGTASLTAGNGIDITGNVISVKVSASTTYTAGGILYHGSTSTISSVALTGIVQGNGASAPTRILPGTTSGVTAGTIAMFSSSSPYLTDSLITQSGSTVTVTGGFTVTGTTTIATSLTGSLKSVAGVISAVTGATNRVAFWSDANTLSSNAGFTYDGTTLTLDADITLTGAQTIATSSGSLTIGSGSEILMTKPVRYSSTATVTDAFSVASGVRTASGGRQSGFINGGQQTSAANSDILAGFFSSPTFNNGATHTGLIAAGFYGDDIGGSGTIATVAHIYLLGITRGSSTNVWQIYSASGNSAFGGSMAIGSTTAPTVTLDVTGSVKVSTLTVLKPVFSDGSKILTSTGTVSVANGGTGVATLAVNGVLYGNGTSAVQAVPVNATATNMFLTQSSSGAPDWVTITTLGTITTGVWNGSVITVPYGGTGVATLTGIVYGNGGAALTAGNGTAGTFAKFSATSPGLANSIMSESGQVLTIAGGTSTIQTSTGSLTLGSASEILTLNPTRFSATLVVYDAFSAGGARTSAGVRQTGFLNGGQQTTGGNSDILAGFYSGGTYNQGASHTGVIAAGFYGDDVGGTGTLATVAHIYLKTITRASSTAIWAIYSQGNNSAFGGNTRFGGVTAPVATVDITGTLTASGITTLTNLGTAAKLVQVNASSQLIASNDLPSGSTVGTFSLARKVRGTFGDGSSTAYAITHNLGTADVVVEIFLVTSGQTWRFDVVRTSTSVVTINTGFAPASNTFGYVIIG